MKLHNIPRGRSGRADYTDRCAHMLNKKLITLISLFTDVL